MGYDPVRDRVVVFGGHLVINDHPNVFADTWEFDGSRWLERRLSSGPSPRDHVSMTWDAGARQLLLHGGGHPDIGILRDSWRFDGTRWTLLTADGPPRARHRMEWDAARSAVVLYGGFEPNQRVNDLWHLRGDRWERITPR
jgi:hypothetical protein